MNKVTDFQQDSEKDDDSEMLDEYDFRLGVKGKYVQRYRKNNLPSLPGIQFFTDCQGRKTAVLVDLKEHSKLWTDILEKHGHPTSCQFLTDEQGEKTGVLLEFKKHLEIWEDIYDRLVANLIS